MDSLTFTIPQAWTWFLAACAGIITIVNTWKAIREVQRESPSGKQAQTLKLHEERLKLIEDRLEHGDQRFEVIDSGNEITQEALLALMSHAINGNDIDSLKEARDKLQRHLITRR